MDRSIKFRTGRSVINATNGEESIDALKVARSNAVKLADLVMFVKKSTQITSHFD